MHIEISASGNAAHVKTEVANQLDAAGREVGPEGWPALASLRDYAAAVVNKAPAGADVELELKVSVTALFTDPE